MEKKTIFIRVHDKSIYCRLLDALLAAGDPFLAYGETRQIVGRREVPGGYVEFTLEPA